ncbi:MAG: TIGR02611 family protein [Segniliparus sp.]|uniref:TIGR02611 family protein n=1 Tax=Segniliparus sp. TaxID=2804064 RepID=UPI003F2FED26
MKLWLRERPALSLAYRIAVAVVGGVVFVAGAVMIPYPGPGWAVLFLGLGILATEFPWAARVLRWAKRQYDRLMAWQRRQPLWLRALLALLALAFTVLTLWLLGALAIAGRLIGLDEPWLRSPLGI